MPFKFSGALVLGLIGFPHRLAAAGPAEPATDSVQAWRADLRFMVRELEERHKNLYHTVSRERFATAVRASTGRFHRSRGKQSSWGWRESWR